MRTRLLAAALLLAALPVAARPPNILLIVVDDLGYGELGCQGNTQIPTPNIDSLARDGVRFSNGYVSAPVCCPSRAGLITGRYQTRFGHEFNAIGLQNLEAEIGLPLGEKTLADRLKARGYATGLVGKWHLGASRAHHPRNRGFDEFYGFLDEGHFYAAPPYKGMITWFRVKSLPPGVAGPRWRKGNYVFSTQMGYTEPMYDRKNPLLRDFDPAGNEPDYLTDAFAREAISFIDRHAAEPWFLYLAYNAPHSPLQSALAWFKKMGDIPDIQRRIFAGMVANLDQSIGRVLDVVRFHELDHDTLVILFSDNGGPTRELTSSNAPLRSGKGHVYEGGIRIPFLMRWTGKLPADKVYGQPVISLDTVPTALAAAGAPIPDNLDGVDLTPYLTDENLTVPHQVLFWRYGNRVALREGEWKVVRESGRGRRDAPFELYDLGSDVSEGENLAGAKPEILERLKQRWEHLNREMAPPRWRSRGSGARKNWPLDLVR